ncbi:MAG TPA: Slp family lipoprotein [Acidiferrobacter sp.]|nr:Slp family lipoprotein [Acidiferrobacter sp.]
MDLIFGGSGGVKTVDRRDLVKRGAWRALAALIVLCFSGCASYPRPHAAHIERGLTPQAVLAHPRATHGARVRWGGIIMSDHHGPAHSTLIILAYPLNGDGRPQLRRAPLRRFQAVTPGYLDPILFAQGRLITVVGTVTGVRAGLIGQARYLYPRLQILKTQLWPQREPHRLHWTFGLGIGISR